MGELWMKELFQLLAKYNKQTNKTMFQILEKMPAEQVTRDMKGYYKSILGTLNHLTMSDINWIRRVSGAVKDLSSLAASLPTVQAKAPTDISWKTLSELKAVRIDIDEKIARMADLIPEKAYTTKITYKNWKGEDKSNLVWHLLLQVFNHQTHHRGTVSVLLDQLGVENDYSSVLAVEP
jgi:uncharacterized damage-inducible protein DinB